MRVTEIHETGAADWRRRPLHPAAVDPQDLLRALAAAGWHVIGRHRSYVRMSWPREESMRGRSVLVPVDPAAGDFEELMRCALRDLINAAETGATAAEALSMLAGARPIEHPSGDPLDAAMYTAFQDGNWRWITRRMTREAREAAVEAVLRYDRYLKCGGPVEELLTRERVALWD